MRIEKKKLSEITPASYNPRQISDSAYNALKSSLERFGLVEPLVWNEQTGNLVGGHQRLKILQNQGIDEIDVVVVELSETEEKALNITLNNQNIMGEFNEDLDSILIELSDDFPEFEDVGLDMLFDGDDKSVKIIPDFNEEVDEEKLNDTKHTCPKCGFAW